MRPVFEYDELNDEWNPSVWVVKSVVFSQFAALKWWLCLLLLGGCAAGVQKHDVNVMFEDKAAIDQSVPE